MTKCSLIFFYFLFIYLFLFYFFFFLGGGGGGARRNLCFEQIYEKHQSFSAKKKRIIAWASFRNEDLRAAYVISRSVEAFTTFLVAEDKFCTTWRFHATIRRPGFNKEGYNRNVNKTIADGKLCSA